MSEKKSAIKSTAGAVLAAGFGSRLRPITDRIPKPLVPVGPAPLLRKSLSLLHEAGLEPLGVNSSYLAPEIDSFIKEIELEVQVSYEESILGTAGGVSQLARLLGATRMVILNGDIYGEIDLRLLAQSESQGLVMGVRKLPPGQGTVGVGKAGEIVRLRGEVFGEELHGGDYLGAAFLGEQALAGLPEQGCLVGDWALPQLRAGYPPHALCLRSDFIDVGSPAELLRANLEYLKQSGRSSWISSSAQVDDSVFVEASVVCAGARVSGKGSLQSCLILPNAVVEAPLFRAIATASGEIIRLP